MIEGLDGSGKETQTERLRLHLLAAGIPVRQVNFPDYQSESSALVKLYLSGAIGGVNDVNAYAASVFYSADRYISYQTGWKNEYLAGHTILCDRYTTSNAVHQMAKLPADQRDAYLDWLYDFEFDRMGLPRPDHVIYLDLEPAVSRELIWKRYQGDPGRADIHERDLDYQLRCREAALYAVERLGWHRIPCCEDGGLLPIEAITERILKIFEGTTRPTSR